MSGVAASLLVLGAGVSTWPTSKAGQRRLGWLAQHRLGRAADGITEPVAAGAGPNSAARKRLRWVASCLSGVLGCLWTQGVVVAMLAACVTAVAHRVWALVGADRDRRAGRADLIVAVAALIDECAAGASLAAALKSSASAAGSRRDAFELAALTVASGADITEAWRGEPGLASLALACSLAADSGAALGAALTAVRDELQADAAVGAAAAEILTGPVSSAVLLALLPILGIGLGALMGADPPQILLHTGWGELALTLGVLFDLAGVLWTARLARRATP